MPSTHDGAIATVRVEGESALGPLAARLAGCLPAQACIALHGDLGAGKTTFVKAVAAAAGIDSAEVVSPTFGLIHEHDSIDADPPLHLVHADLYRLAGLDELREIGWGDAIAARPSCRVWAFIEWPERIAVALPPERIDVSIAIDSETCRTLTFTGHGPAHAAAVACLGIRDEV